MSDGEDHTTPRHGLDVARGEDRTVEVAVVSRAEYDRLRAIEDAARAVVDDITAPWSAEYPATAALDRLRAALEGAPRDQ